MRETKREKYYASIDGLRAYGALGIVIMHVQANGFSELKGFLFQEIIPSFTNLVFLFMAISAFGLCCGYYEKFHAGNICLSEFYKRRFQKIWPYFAVLVLIDLALSPSKTALYEAFADLTLVFGFLPDGGNITVIGVGWFLGLIFVFYMLFPFFCFLLENKKRAWLSFGVMLAYNAACMQYFQADRKNILYSACYFMAGGLIYLYREQMIRAAGKLRYIAPAAWLVITAGAFYFGISGSTIVMLVSFSLLLAYALTESGKAGCAVGCIERYSWSKWLMGGGILKNTPVKFISSISMEIYLSHMVIYRGVEKAGLLYVFGRGPIGYMAACIAVLGGTILFSLIVRQGIAAGMRQMQLSGRMRL